MKKGDVYPSKYLKPVDVGSNGLVLTITDVKTVIFKDQAKGTEESKPVAYFAETKKGLPINRTNWDLIVDVTGEDDTDDWKGQRVKLIVEEVEAFGKDVEGIRVTKAPKARVK
jgi:hypothetical protein